MNASEENYIEVNRNLWNKRTEVHLGSAFYDIEGFLKGNTSLKEIELALLGNIAGKKVLHLQCHFGQDTISLVRMGALATGVDLSDKAIESARELAEKADVEATFICCSIYDLRQHLDEQFDIVFTTYGTIGWLPDLGKWAEIISFFLKPGGKLVFAEFHPVVWMFDNDFNEIAYNYFKADAIIETESGTYADKAADLTLESVSWNHALGDVVSNLILQGLEIDSLLEYDYSPYDIFGEMTESESGRFRVKKLGNKIPLVYSILATRK